MAVLTTLFLLVVCFVVQHVRNLCAGKYGLSAIPLYDYLMKKCLTLTLTLTLALALALTLAVALPLPGAWSSRRG